VVTGTGWRLPDFTSSKLALVERLADGVVDEAFGEGLLERGDDGGEGLGHRGGDLGVELAAAAVFEVDVRRGR
jgi:hypothetical protein